MAISKPPKKARSLGPASEPSPAPSSSSVSVCSHPTLTFAPSSTSAEAGYHQPKPALRSAAAGRPNDSLNRYLAHSSTFPAPLVLPGDDLTWEDEYDPQSLQDWIDEPERNAVTKKRRTVYVARPPVVSPSVAFVDDWSKPRGTSREGKEPRCQQPRTEDLVEYLRAFYHPLPVKILPERTLTFSRWDGNDPQPAAERLSKNPAFVGLDLASTKEKFGIAVRRTPGMGGTAAFSHQLHLDALLDAAISMLPKDAYALLFVVHHDLYESKEDDFCCGRAYGGSRVAVVSTARYNPALDEIQGLGNAEHAWPASHCTKFVDEECNGGSKKHAGKKRKRGAISSTEEMEGTIARRSNLGNTSVEEHIRLSPMEAAVEAHMASSWPSSETSSRTSLWLPRLCRTASHELGHCFGLDHCVYYACSMQSTASMPEDVRQPPYLCPVDLAKVLKATGGTETERYKALLSFCGKHSETALFAAFAAWLRRRLVLLSTAVVS